MISRMDFHGVSAIVPNHSSISNLSFFLSLFLQTTLFSLFKNSIPLILQTTLTLIIITC